LLQRAADCTPTEQDWALLQTRASTALSKEENASFDAAKYIVATNDARNRINHEKMGLFSPVMKIEQCDDGLHISDEQALDGERVDDTLSDIYAIGAEVMLTVNLWTETGLVNGACGVVESILTPTEQDSKSRVLMVNFPSYRGPSLSTTAPTVVPITHIRTPRFTGIPLTLAWAVTIHKAQGLTMERVTVDLGSREFASGMTFVALSRAKRFDGLRIIPFDWERYKRIGKGKLVNARREEFTRLRQLAAMTARDL
jgi:ATP-dependent DNA helicase PIF1